MRPAWQIDGKEQPALNETTLPAVPERTIEAHPTARRATGQVVTLKWDFCNTFPVPLDSAIENGRLYESDLEPQNLAGLHDEHARHALAILSDVDAIAAAKVEGVDPATGKPPRTAKQRESLTKLYAERPSLLLHSFEVLMDVYAEAFGDDAALAFKQAITSWHAGAEVVRDRTTPAHESVTLPPVPPGPDGLPIARPLRSAVAAGTFGYEGDLARAVDPSDEEVTEITLSLASELHDVLLAQAEIEPPLDAAETKQTDAACQAALQRYADDFGGAAAAALNQHVRERVKVTIAEADAYGPGHPWHYLEKGDGARPVPAEAIPPPQQPFDPGVKLPKNPEKKRATLAKMLEDAQRQLALDKERYTEIVEKGVAALSDYDRKIAHAGDEELAWASAVALKFNHVRNGLWRIEGLGKMITDTTQGMLV